ncbi:MAG: hypothetical protein GY847_34055 [Proteobacteria bacterium]|nr:hypothetical protein [Pseudomonadota bacterium]
MRPRKLPGMPYVVLSMVSLFAFCGCTADDYEPDSKYERFEEIDTDTIGNFNNSNRTSNADTDMDTDTETDSDSDKDNGAGFECKNSVKWGRGIRVGKPIANWSLPGYVDSDGDFVVEQENVIFNMAQIHCTGKQSAVLITGDTT